MGFSEALSYTPILGCSAYLAFITGNMADTIPPMGVQPYGFFVKIAGDIKKAVNVPVSAVGRIVDADICLLYTSCYHQLQL